MIRRSLLVLTALVCLCCIIAPLRGGDSRLAAAIEAVVHEPNYKHAHWGILVADLESGKTLYELNADQLFVPASTTKLYSCAAALDAFGPDYRFKTPVVRRGNVDDKGVLHGDLILIASGDLTMGGRTDQNGKIAFKNVDHTYANGSTKGEITEADPRAGLIDLAQRIAKAGIKRVTGDVLIDDRLFDQAASTGSGPTRLTPIMINDNLIDMLMKPTEGKQVALRTQPATNAYLIDAHLETRDSRSGDPFVRITQEGSNRYSLRASLPAGSKPLLRVQEVEDPVSFARTLFIDALQRAEVKVDASAFGANHAEKLPPRETVKELPKVAEFTSPPFSENIKLILKVSHNLHASTLPLLVAAKNGKRTLRDGLRLQHDFLAKAGVDVDTISFGGGAGGDRADSTTPRATIQLLRHMATRPDFPVYHDALPILGVDGTLADVVSESSPARGKVHAKTGTYTVANVMNDRFLLTSKALAGYVTTANGRKLVVAMFVNNTHLNRASETSREGKTLGRLCEIIYGTE